MEKKPKWCDTYYVKIFQGTIARFTDQDMANSLDVSLSTYLRWKATKPAIQQAIKEAYNVPDMQREEMQLKYNIHSILTPELKELWDKVNLCNTVEHGIFRLEVLLRSVGYKAKQALFIHALLKNNFNVSKALKKINITRGTYESWRATDSDFAAIMEEVKEVKGDFYEEALVKQVKLGNPRLIAFANKTYNSKRGYGETIKIDQRTTSQNVNVELRDDDLEQIPLDTKWKLLKAVENKQNTQSNGIHKNGKKPVEVDPDDDE